MPLTSIEMRMAIAKITAVGESDRMIDVGSIGAIVKEAVLFSLLPKTSTYTHYEVVRNYSEKCNVRANC
ncbi:MAG: hypothetical protein LH647_11805 [Leptolyngbyaceae cyanobacterium CAN_BIN12]|nr:hypothetical protein [Leptolyngbyaceae cyanobacterium CAN_BIN12]